MTSNTWRLRSRCMQQATVLAAGGGSTKVLLHMIITYSTKEVHHPLCKGGEVHPSEPTAIASNLQLRMAGNG